MTYSESHQNISDNLQAIASDENKLREELKRIRDTQSYLEQGYASFEHYCNAELAVWGGYVRVQGILTSEGWEAP